MKNTEEYSAAVSQLLEKAKSDLAADLLHRGFGAVIWDNSTAGFHFIPAVLHRSKDKDKTRVAVITGLYLYGDTLYLIEEDRSGVSIDNFYNKDTEVRPSVVTLTPDMASRTLGDPDNRKGFTSQGSLDEWLAIADCYFMLME